MAKRYSLEQLLETEKLSSNDYGSNDLAAKAYLRRVVDCTDSLELESNNDSEVNAMKYPTYADLPMRPDVRLYKRSCNLTKLPILQVEVSGQNYNTTKKN